MAKRPGKLRLHTWYAFTRTGPWFWLGVTIGVGLVLTMCGCVAQRNFNNITSMCSKDKVVWQGKCTKERVKMAYDLINEGNGAAWASLYYVRCRPLRGRVFNSLGQSWRGPRTRVKEK